MFINHVAQKVQVIITLLIILVVSGCRVHEAPTGLIVALPDQDKIDLHVELVLSQELYDSEWSTSFGAGGQPLKIGGLLFRNIEKTVKSAFSQVTVTRYESNPENTADVILTPKLYHTGSLIQDFRDTSASIEITWLFFGENGKRICAIPIKGTGHATRNPAFLGIPKENMRLLAIISEKATYDFCTQSYHAFYENSEIKKLAN